MKHLLAALALMLVCGSASAGLLIDCQVGVDGYGRTVWIGTYNHNGQIVTMMFPMGRYSYCPSLI